jgi:hypothetical protein
MVSTLEAIRLRCMVESRLACATAPRGEGNGHADAFRGTRQVHLGDDGPAVRCRH